MKKYLSVIIIIVFGLNIFPGCKKDKGNPPVLPPAGSMVIDFSNFETQKKSSDLTLDNKGVDDVNWAFAATVAGVWKTIIYTTLAIPVGAFKLATDTDPVYLDDNTWQWNYNASLMIGQISTTYKARLTGQIRSNDVLWKMYIAREGTGAFPEFSWFEGTSNLDGKGGQWILNHSSQFPDPLLRIDWTRNSSAIATIKYTYVRELNNEGTTDPFKDSYIEYGLTSNPLNAYYKIRYFNGIRFSDVDVEWNTTNHNGRVKAPLAFPTANWYCWDGNLVDITCPI
jgi:hypothetical protein